jgi:hypothetical protein
LQAFALVASPKLGLRHWYKGATCSFENFSKSLQEILAKKYNQCDFKIGL